MVKIVLGIILIIIGLVVSPFTDIVQNGLLLALGGASFGGGMGLLVYGISIFSFGRL